MPLNDLAIKNLRPAEKSYKRSDGGGLNMLVKANGSKLWRLSYRFNGKQKELAFGSYPSISLARARELRDAAKSRIADGRDPAVEKRRNRDEAEKFKSVAKRWFDARKATLAASYSSRLWARIEANLLPQIGEMPVRVIQPQDLLDALRKIEGRKRVYTAKRVRALAGSVFRFAIAEGIATHDPSAALVDALAATPRVKHMASLSAGDLPAFFAKVESYPGEKQIRYALRFVLLTMVRTKEARFAERSEFEGMNGSEPLWRIPAERMKPSAGGVRRPHLVPLSKQAAKLALAIMEGSNHDRFLFPSWGRDGVLSQNAMIRAMYIMGYAGKATVHGFRGTASTILNEQEFDADWIEVQLAHTDQNKIRSAYNAAEYLTQRRKMMQWWGDYLDKAARRGRLIS